ncbi:hypothetical protein PY650_14375 [Rhizobium calliandrae]|uniref:Uncharacterized protein n=1 Tax=Rhizobium calliandrae TaxID=1312182 RepID=A0ABT7KDX7_9HYPH|nr:hypothetical protein [Rhizobium calliandrae]MDL2406824.1 hypothetical protein [Rhizobium calliandrae]
MSAFPPKKALNAAVLGLALSQVATPLARLFPGDDFIHDQWVTLYCFELGLGMVCLAAVGLIRLPPSERERTFEPLDFISYPLIAVGMALLTAVIGLGRYEWWTDRDWLGWCLAAAVPILVLSVLFESCRTRPLLDLRWLGSQGPFRFLLVVLALRFALAQQTIAFGILSNSGVLSVNTHAFSIVLVCAAVAGCVVAAAVVTPTNILFVGATGLAIAALAAWMESFSTNLTKAPELLLSEAMISFATTLAVGPSIGVGSARSNLTMRQGTLPRCRSVFPYVSPSIQGSRKPRDLVQSRHVGGDVCRYVRWDWSLQTVITKPASARFMNTEFVNRCEIARIKSGRKEPELVSFDHNDPEVSGSLGRLEMRSTRAWDFLGPDWRG